MLSADCQLPTVIYEFNGYRPVIHESSFVHPQAAVTGNVITGQNVYIAPGAAVRGDWGKIIIAASSSAILPKSSAK